MASFGSGLLTGCLLGLLVALLVGIIAYARFDRLQRMTRRAERLAELGTLTGGLAHEIKNPLSTIQFNLQLLREDLPPDDPGYSRLISRLDTVRKEATRLRDFLDDFLRYAGRIELDCKPTDVHRMLEELIDFFAPQANLQRVQLRMKPPADGQPLVVSLDEKLIKQAVLNLLINALQAMPEAGGEIILSARKGGGRALIEVADTGPGIPRPVLSQIFNAYYSTKKAGSGLGLAIARRAVEEHHGAVRAESEVGKGSIFTIELPL